MSTQRILVHFATALSCLALASTPSAAHADEDLSAGVRLGLGPQFATAPEDTMLTGQTLVAMDYVGDASFGFSAEMGYSGERRGRLAGRHFVIGGAFRYGSLVGINGLLHGIVGRTQTALLGKQRSGGFRLGGRLDIHHVTGFDIQYEHRSIDGLDGESGFRIVLWFDAIALLNAVG